MITSILNPRIDYLEIGVKVQKPVASMMSMPTQYEILMNYLKLQFNLKHEDKSEGTFKELWVKGGLNIEARSSTMKITFKGEAFYSKRTWYQIKILAKNLDLLGMNWYLKRIDIRRSFIGETIDPLIDLKAGFWINRASPDAFFQPELITKSSNTKSVACYFKSNFFYISVYSKTDQINGLNKKLGKVKKQSHKDKINKTIWAYKNENPEGKDIKRFEIRLLSKSKANNYIYHLRNISSEEKFCFDVLESFYGSHPMKKKQLVSTTYKEFFFKKKEE